MIERTGVIVIDGVVVNHILWGEETASQLTADGYTQFEETTQMNPRPGMYWTWTLENGYRPPSPFPSWGWSDGQWVAPKAMPDDGQNYEWDEKKKNWVLVPEGGG